VSASVLFGIINVTFISKVDPYEFGRLIAVLIVIIPILIIVTTSSLIYEIRHTIKKDVSDLDNIKYEEKFKGIKIISSIILAISLVTSTIYIWPSIIHPYFFVSIYILARFILIIFSILTIYLATKKLGFVNIILWFVFLILTFMQFFGVGLISFRRNYTQGDIYYNRDQINKKLDSIKRSEALNTGNVTLCFEQENSDSRANCVISLVEKNSDINLCNEVYKISYIRGEGAYISNKPLYYKSQCYLAVAKKTSNYDLCNKMIIEANVSSFYTQCLTYFAVQKRDVSICDLYFDYYKNNSKDYDLNNPNDVEHIKQMAGRCKEQAENGKLW